ncbi:MAG TPA: ornithine--oxo-acid transaminase [Fimbriimonadaceae bacterium]|nr:ornithine--oxo-acid transaminase [Fimbriimonadaceae bacterium]
MKNVHKQVASLTDEQAIEMTEKYGAHNYHPLHVNVVRGEGCYAYDGSGKKYIDCIGSYSAVANGHLSEYIVKTVKEQLDILTLTSRAVYTSEMALFLKELCEYTEADMACPMNTGAEAVETAIKLARKWAYEVKGVPDQQAEIIVAHQNFHGRTVTIVSFSTEAGTKDHFGPYTPGFKVVPFGDLDAVKAAITPNTCAVLMEPVQAEGGILFPPKGFMKEMRELCTKENVLLIWDEIQTGFCRTGKKFAWMHEGAKPDLMCVGKALGGGIMPVSAVVGTKEVMGVFHPGDHGSTFGGNPLGSVIGIATIEEMNAKGLEENSAKMGARLMEGFKKLNYECVEEVRGEGLLVGLEVKEGIDTVKLGKAFIENGVLTKETRSRTFRFAPPLIITPEIVDEVVEKVGKALSTVSKQLVSA